MAAIDKVKVLVVGDSGVGKTSLVNLIAYNETIKSPSWTVGCSVEVKLHEYKEAMPQQKTYFVELWDVGGSNQHRNARSVFYNPVHGKIAAVCRGDVKVIFAGIILVHDLSNRKSQENLQKWLSEIINGEERNILSSPSGKYISLPYEDFDQENFVGSTQIPILVIGTKLDVSEDKYKAYQQLSNTVAKQCGAEEIFLDCRKKISFQPGSTNAVKLSRFFDLVIERRYYSREVSPFGERRKYPSPYYNSTNLSANNAYTRYYHRD